MKQRVRGLKPDNYWCHSSFAGAIAPAVLEHNVDNPHVNRSDRNALVGFSKNTLPNNAEHSQALSTSKIREERCKRRGKKSGSINTDDKRSDHEKKPGSSLERMMVEWNRYSDHVFAVHQCLQTPEFHMVLVSCQACLHSHQSPQFCADRLKVCSSDKVEALLSPSFACSVCSAKIKGGQLRITLSYRWRIEYMCETCFPVSLPLWLADIAGSKHRILPPSWMERFKESITKRMDHFSPGVPLGAGASSESLFDYVD